MNLADLTTLHDAQLATISVDWVQKEVHMRIRHGWPSRWSDLTLKGLHRLSVTTLDEWGPSAHIHRIHSETIDGGYRYLVEMQSGDVIDIAAESIDLNAVGE